MIFQSSNIRLAPYISYFPTLRTCAYLPIAYLCLLAYCLLAYIAYYLPTLPLAGANIRAHFSVDEGHGDERLG